MLLWLLLFPLVAGYRRKAVGCEGSRLELYCEGEKVISVLRANYGRISSSVCGESRGEEWSTRCIQPRTLREVTSRCSSHSGSLCSLEVSSTVFGDPCPNTPKYLEVVYTCSDLSQPPQEAGRDLNIPPWLLSLETITDIIRRKNIKTTPTPSTTPSTTAPTTSSSSPPPILVSGDLIRRPSEEFLLYIQQAEQRKKQERLQQLVNRPVVSFSQEPSSQSFSLQDNTVLLAVLISVIIMVSLLSLSLLVFSLRRRCRQAKPEEESSDSESTTSTYLQYSVQGSDYSYVMGRDGRIYQVISPYRPGQGVQGENNEYEEVDKIAVLS